MVPGGRVAAAMKQVALLARVTVWTAALVAALVGRSVLADAPPGCTDRLFAPPSTPHFALPNAGPWEGYRGAAIEHDWPEARRMLAGPRPPSFRPLRSLFVWLESLLMPRARHSSTCMHCQPIGFDLGYDPLPGDGLYYGDETPKPAPPPSPEFNPMPVPTPEAEGPAVAPSPMLPMTPVEPPPPKTPTLPPMNEIPPVERPVEPAPKATTPPEPKPAGAPIVELAPEVPLPMDPPATTLPPRNTIPKSTPRPPKNIVPLKGMPGR